MEAIAYFQLRHRNTVFGYPHLFLFLGPFCRSMGFLFRPQQPDWAIIGQPVDRVHSASLAELLAFSWPEGLFNNGKSLGINLQDMPVLDRRLRTGLLIDEAPRYDQTGKLWAWLLKVHSTVIALQWCIALLRAATSLAPQYITLHILRSLESHDVTKPVATGTYVIMLANGLFLELWVGKFLSWFTMTKLQIPMQAVLSSLVYRKTLRLHNFDEAHGENKDTKASPSSQTDMPPNSLKSIDNHLQLDT